MKPCVYRTDDTGRKDKDRPIYNCHIHEQCLTEGKSKTFAVCHRCKQRLEKDDPEFASKWIDPLTVFTRKKKKTDVLHNFLGGRSAFLIGGGPSANQENLERLNERGTFCLCINNVAGHSRFRPHAFVCSDPPSKFSSSIWLDPQIMKLIPHPKLSGGRSKLRRKLPDGSFEPIETRTHQCPNTWGFQRHSYFTPDDDFFMTDGAMWGNHRAGVERTGQPKTVCTMLLGLRLLYYLGARRIYMVGVDFRMADDWGYSFAQGRTEGACKSNNGQFKIVNDWLCTMQNQGVFKKFGLAIYNCYERSGLRAFPYVPFDQAVDDVVGIIERTPDLRNWYEKK